MAHPKPNVLIKRPVRVCRHCGLLKRKHTPRHYLCPAIADQPRTRYTPGAAAQGESPNAD